MKNLPAAIFCLVGSWSSVCLALAGAAEKSPTEVVLSCEASAGEIRFAGAEVRKALEQNGYVVTQKRYDRSWETQVPLLITIGTSESGTIEGQPIPKLGIPKLGEQQYVIRKIARPDAAAYLAFGGDPVGAMYAGLELAEQIRLGKGLDAVQETSGCPHHLRRGLKMNIPLDARTPSYDDTGDSAQQNYANMWDFAFWQEFLDEMARHRYNALTLWNPHPFPSLVKCPDYPDVALEDVCVTTLKPTWEPGAWHDPQFLPPTVYEHLQVVKKMTMEEKIAFWRRVMRHARDRGIDVYFITWNVLTNGTRGQYGITNDQDNPQTIAYLRQCTRELILTYPDLAGIGVTAGENMRKRNDEFSKEKFLWAAYGLGVLDAKKEQPGRTVQFIHRVWQTGVGEVFEQFGSKYPDPFELGFKYAKAHMYSSTDPPFADRLCEEMKPYQAKCWWNLRNDDIFNFRWGDPDYAREFLLNLPEGQTAGYHMGSDGYVWAREFTSIDPDTPRALEIQKHWYNFMLWGRLGYNPKLDREFFERTLAWRFPATPAAPLYDAWATASKIIPQVNRFHWQDWDFMWAVEGCLDQRHGFHSVDDFIQIGPMERSGIVPIPEFVDNQLAGKPTDGLTPLQVADNLEKYARDSLATVAKIREKTPQPGKELRQTLADIQAMAYLGDYYGAKIRGAVELCAFRKSKDVSRQEAAVKHLEEAVRHWQSYAGVATAQYRPQLLARTRRLDWTAATEDVKRDVEIARRTE